MKKIKKTSNKKNNVTQKIGTIQNIGEPIHLANIKPLAGFTVESVDIGQQIKVWTKKSLTSDDPLFHLLVENLSGIINHMTKQTNSIINSSQADTILLILKPDCTAELWLDTAAITITCSVKRAIKAGTVLFENDIADITEMSFPCVDFGEKDQVLCVFRQGWRFGFAFDMNPDGNFNQKEFSKTLGSLYRQMRYKNLYCFFNEVSSFKQLVTKGWFPFVEIIGAEFNDILQHHNDRLDLLGIEEKTVKLFDSDRCRQILERWLTKPHFISKSTLLREAILAFNNNQPVAVIKILLTEIEGVLNDAYRSSNSGKGAKLKKLLEFAEQSAELKSGSSNTLLFPKEFGFYLKEYTFANFDPRSQSGTAGSRHAVGHGAASQESYTITRALQVILTFDQLAFYT